MIKTFQVLLLLLHLNSYALLCVCLRRACVSVCVDVVRVTYYNKLAHFTVKKKKNPKNFSSFTYCFIVSCCAFVDLSIKKQKKKNFNVQKLNRKNSVIDTMIVIVNLCVTKKNQPFHKNILLFFFFY